MGWYAVLFLPRLSLDMDIMDMDMDMHIINIQELKLSLEMDIQMDIMDIHIIKIQDMEHFLMEKDQLEDPSTSPVSLPELSILPRLRLGLIQMLIPTLMTMIKILLFPTEPGYSDMADMAEENMEDGEMDLDM